MRDALRPRREALEDRRLVVEVELVEALVDDRRAAASGAGSRSWRAGSAPRPRGGRPCRPRSRRARAELTKRRSRNLAMDGRRSLRERADARAAPNGARCAILDRQPVRADRRAWQASRRAPPPCASRSPSLADRGCAALPALRRRLTPTRASATAADVPYSDQQDDGAFNVQAQLRRLRSRADRRRRRRARRSRRREPRLHGRRASPARASSPSTTTGRGSTTRARTTRAAPSSSSRATELSARMASCRSLVSGRGPGVESLAWGRRQTRGLR